MKNRSLKPQVVGRNIKFEEENRSRLKIKNDIFMASVGGKGMVTIVIIKTGRYYYCYVK